MTSDKYPKESVQFILSQLQRIASAVMFAAEAEKLEIVFERIAQLTCDFMGVRYAALGIPDEEGSLAYFKVAGMTPDEIALIDHLPHGHGLLGAIIEDRETILLDDLSQDSRSYGFPKNHPDMQRFLGTPIQVADRLYGMLYLCDRLDGQPFTEDDKWLVETIAGYAALAIAGSQLREKENRLTLLEERQRISMDLHDGVIQSLYAVGMHLDMMNIETNGSKPDLRPAIQSLNEVIDDIRNYIMNLKRSEVQRETIRTCIHDVVNRLHIPRSIDVHVDAPDTPPRFPTSTFESICQILNEVLSNAVRHANASTILITVVQNDDTLLVTVKDDGVGFNLSELAENNGLGLQNIHHRAHLYQGRIMIETAPGEGTRITLKIPVPA